MAYSTITEQNDRIRLIMAAYPSMGTDLSEGAALASLPAFIVNPLGATRQEQGARRFIVTRDFEIIGLVSLMSNITSLANRLTVYQDAEDVLEAWVAWLNGHPRLRAPNGTTDNGLVLQCGGISDSGFGPYTYGEKDYSAFRLQLPVTTYRT